MKKQFVFILSIGIMFSLNCKRAAEEEVVSITEGEGYIDVTGGKVWYRIVGSGTATPLLLLNGGPGAPSSYLEPLEKLSDERPIIFYDQMLTPEEERRLSVTPQIKPEAYKAYLKGLFYWNKRTGEDLRKAINYFEKAIEEEPDYALAYVGLADCYNLLSIFSNVPPAESLPRAREAALKAIALDKTSGEAHNSLAYAIYRYNWDFDEAEREFKRAIELSPNYATAHFWYGEFLMTQGRFDEAFREMNLALELDPVSLIINSIFGVLYIHSEQPEKAVLQLLKTLEMNPNFALARSQLSLAYAQLNKFPEAIAEGKKAVELSGGLSFYMSDLGSTYGMAEKDNEAKRIIEELKEISNKHYVSSIWIAYVYVSLGENDKAFEWLEKAYEERHEGLVYIKTNPNLNPIRTDPRFSELLKKIGLE